jgi:L-ascorbate metabolism protein UlaG (beta-lactamase superfamily)
MKLTWLGQGGFLLESASCRVAVDPYLSDALAAKGLERMSPPPCTPAELAPSLVVCTHDHDDHLDPQTVVPMALARCDCRFAGPPAVVAHLVRLGVSQARCDALTAGGRMDHGCFSIAAAPARHEGDAIGVVAEAEGLRVYISGDTLFFDELVQGVRRSAGGALDVAAVCINGRWGNMTWQEAARVVGDLRPRLAIPMHYGMFRANTVDPAPFLAAAREMGLEAVAMEVGRTVELRELLK